MDVSLSSEQTTSTGSRFLASIISDRLVLPLNIKKESLPLSLLKVFGGCVAGALCILFQLSGNLQFLKSRVKMLSPPKSVDLANH